MAVEFPDFEDKYEEDEESVRARMDADADPDVDKREGSFYQITTEPAVMEFTRIWDILNDVIAINLYLYANGIYLDYKAAEVGLTRKPAVKSVGSVTFSGTNGTVVPSGTRVSTTALTETDQPVRLVTTAAGTVASGVAIIAVEAESAGADGNVAASGINVIEDSVPGITAVVNAAAISGGADLESDDDLRERIALEIAAPQGAGNKSDYIKWSRSRAGVGPNVTVIPRWAGVNTVKVVLLDNDNNPVSQAVMDDVQQYLTGPPKLSNPTTTATIAEGAAGSLTGTFDYKITFTDGYGQTKGSAATNAVTVSGKKIDLSAIPIGPVGTTARKIYRRSGSGKYFLVHTLADNSTATYTDDNAATSTVLPKTNNTTNNDGIAPVGADVTVDTPDQVPITTVAVVQFQSGYSLDGVGGTIATRSTIEAALQEYVNALAPGADVIYKHHESKFFDVEGVLDLTSMTINGGTSNIAISDSEVADAGTITLS